MTQPENGERAIGPDPNREYAEEYEQRNGKLQETIDVLAQYTWKELEEHGAKSRIAEEHDVSSHRIHYVLDRWPHLVKHRRFADADPLDPEAVKEGYDDPVLQQMSGRAVADGAGDLTIPIEMPLDQIFRAVKLLPADMGMDIFSQVLEKADTLPREELMRIMGEQD